MCFALSPALLAQGCSTYGRGLGFQLPQVTQPERENAD